MLKTTACFGLVSVGMLLASSSHAALIADLDVLSSSSIPEGGTVTFRSDVRATSGHIGGGSVSYSPGGPAQRLSGPSGYSLFHGPTLVNSPGTTVWRYLDNGSFTHAMLGGGSEHNPFHQTIWSGSFSSQSTARATISVVNVAPTIQSALLNGVAGNLTVNEDQTVLATMTATDPGQDPISFFIGGMSGGVGGSSPGSTRTSSAVDFSAFDDGVYNLPFFADDGDGGVVSTARILTVLNLDPVIGAITGDLTVGVGESFSFSVSATDPGDDPITIDWDLDNDSQFDDLSAAGGMHSFPAVGLYPVSVIVRDDDGGSIVGSFNVNVVPEPNSFFLATLGLFALGMASRRKDRPEQAVQ